MQYVLPFNLKNMKLIIPVLLLVMLTGSLNGFAQDESDSRTKLAFGLKVGTNFSNVYDSEGEEFDADPRLGFVGAAFIAIPIGAFLGVQPEIAYSQRGFQGSGVILGGHYDISRTSNYLDIPVFFVLKPIETVSIMAGPQFSYLISQKDVFSNGVTTIEQELAFENDNIRKNTLCFVTGLDINVNHFVISGRAGWDLFKNNGDGTSTTPRYKNVWGQLTIGYRIF